MEGSVIVAQLGYGKFGQVKIKRFVKSLQPVLFKIIEELTPAPFCLTHDYTIAMGDRFTRHNCGMNPSQNHLGTFFPENRSQLVSPGSDCSHTGDSHQVIVFVRLDLLNLFLHHIPSISGGVKAEITPKVS